MSRLTDLEEGARNRGLAVHTWSPGDGVTRYRFFPLPEDSGQTYFGPANGIFTALGLKEAWGYVEAYGAGRNSL